MAIHVSTTLANAENLVENLAKNVEEALEYLSKNEMKMSFGAAIYGITEQIPTAQMEKDGIKAYVAATLM